MILKLVCLHAYLIYVLPRRVCKSSAKELDNADKSALKLLEILFTPEELVNGNLTGSTTSKDEWRKATVQKLAEDRIKIIQDIT